MRRESNRLNYLAEFSASLADLGTFLPLVLGVLVVTSLDPVGVLFGFGVFALATGWIYRRPIPVQPMKAVAALGMAGLLTHDGLIATTVVMGVVLLVLSRSDVLSRVRHYLPNSLMHGLKLSLAVSLVMAAEARLDWHWMEVAFLLTGLVLLQWTPLKPVSALIFILVGMLLWTPPDALFIGIDPSLPTLGWPSSAGFLSALVEATLPQLILTVTNALILTAVIAQSYYPDDSSPITEQRLAQSSGWANLLLAPFGALPMCHGAGGLVAHHALGGRSGWAIGFFGLLCLVLGLGFGQGTVQILAAIPGSVVVMLVLYAAWQIADLKSMVALKPSCYLVIATIVVISWAWGLLPAIAAGWALEALRTRRLASSGTAN